MTTEIKCPKCGEVFTVDEAGYAAIVKQVRDREFKKELDDRSRQFEEAKEMLRSRLMAEEQERAAKLTADKEKEAAQRLAEKEAALAEKEKALLTLQAEKDQELQALQAKLDQEEGSRKLAVTEAIADKEKEAAQRLAEKEAALAEKEKALLTLQAEKDQELQALQNRLDAFETAKKLELTEAQAEADRRLEEARAETANARNQIILTVKEAEIAAEQQKKAFDARLAEKDELIAFYKDFKTRQSTKMLGESLEQHCEIEFNRLRATAFRGAYFDKDNDARTGSKGDYIYREYTADGTEFISIMFDMKNEMDTTATKHKNEDFLKELDKDRNEKKCEYAVLVSMLESDSELYNQGIVDVSHRYPKMYVIRPQFFIPLITILRDAALNAASYRQQLAEVQAQNIDITNFETAVNEFKDKFGKNFINAGNSFNKAIDEIDKAIKQMEAVKEDLRLTVKHLSEANTKVDGLTIKRLTRGNPTMQQKFAELHADDEN